MSNRTQDEQNILNAVYSGAVKECEEREHVRAGRSALEIENDRNEFKGRLEDMLSKPDETPPWARAENGEVLFGLLMDGSDEEAHDIDTAEALASSLWRAAREARSQRKFLPGDVS